MGEPGIPNVRSRTTYEKPYVRSLFDRIAHRYDLLNHLLSFGIDVYWRKKAIRLLSRFQPRRILDVATGTADLAIAATYLQPQQIIGVDLSNEMLNIGRQKIADKNLDAVVSLQAGDAENLPFPDSSFDALTVAFGVRNFSDFQQGLREMHRVLQNRGVAVILEFSQPTVFPIRQLYSLYSKYVMPVVGGLISRQREAYEYLPSTVHEFPQSQEMIDILLSAGFTSAEQHRLTFGIATIYLATK